MRTIFLVSVLALAACNAPEGEIANNTVSAADTREAADTAANSADVVSEDEAVQLNPVADCVRRGIAYFKEIGSYPTLSSAPNRGRDAADVAVERCNRTTTAFP
ncbi:MAG TPA: hypothetical protein VGC35_11485 [Allosphingosinicella sp.]|jgi:hypothetical protein